MAALQPLLEFHGAAKFYGQRLIFRHVSASFLPGSISLLAGANGSGKSTLMKMAAGLTRPDAGDVFVHAAPDRIGYMAHATFLYPALEARENLLFWARAAAVPDPLKKVDDALELTGLARSAYEKAGVFSRGMAQRLNLARLLLTDPMLILLDEPTTGLDQNSRVILRDVVREARSRGAAVLWISHDLKEDLLIADRLFVLKDQTLFEEDISPC